MPDSGKSNKALIVETANKLVYIKGFNQTSFADIADELGLSKGNLHYHYRSKDELLTAIVEHRLADIRAQLERWTEQYTAPVDRLKRFVKMVQVSEAEIVRYGCPMGSLNAELGKDQPLQQQQARQMFDQYRDWLEACFKQLGLKNSKGLANHLLAMVQGAALMAYIYADGKLLKKECLAVNDWIDSLL